MPLVDYILNGPSRVIFDDKRDPFESWRRHERTTGRGGVDLVAAKGTEVLAPTDGWLDRWPNDGSAGNSCRFRHAKNAGWADVFSHLSWYAGERSGQFFRQGQPLALSGDSGAPGQPHVHRHLLDPRGNRQNPWLYFSASASASASGVPLKLIPMEESMSQTVRLNKRHQFSIGQEFISHHATEAQADITRMINSASDEMHDVDSAKFVDFLDGVGVPRNVVDLNTGGVLNPETGKLEINGVWSRGRQATADTARLIAKLGA